MKKLGPHPLADVFPMMSDDEIDELAADVEANGLVEPIVLYEGAILDGRNRYAACRLAKVEPTLVEYEGDDPASFVASLNALRRHLTVGQRAMGLAMLYAPNGKWEGRQRQEVVHDGQIGSTSMSRAIFVLARDRDLAEQVVAGTVTLGEAEQTLRDRDKAKAKTERDRATLIELAPDLAEQVAAEVIALAEALDAARERERKERDERRDAVDLLDRVLGLVSPDVVAPDFVDAWARRLGSVSKTTVEKTRRAADVLAALAERMVTE